MKLSLIGQAVAGIPPIIHERSTCAEKLRLVIHEEYSLTLDISEECVTVKCYLRDAFQLERRLNDDVSWAVQYFHEMGDSEATCKVTPRLGPGLENIVKKWPVVTPLSSHTLASIGIDFVNFLTELHFKYQLADGNLVPSRFATRYSDVDHLVIFDGFLKMKRATVAVMTKDARQVMHNVRYLWKGESEYSHLDTSPDVCGGGFDKGLCSAIQRV